MPRDRMEAIDCVLGTLGELWSIAANAAPTCGLSYLLECELHALNGIRLGLLQPPQTTLESADHALIGWLDHLQSWVSNAEGQIRAGATDEALRTLDAVSVALTTYRATRQLRMLAVAEWTRLANGDDQPEERWPAERHQQVYSSKRDLPRFEFNWIEDWLLAGRNPLTVLDVQLLKALGVTHVLDLREEKEWTPPKFGAEALEAVANMALKRLHLPVRDGFSPSPEQFEAACDFLSSVEREPGARAYVHCRGGMERTACVLTAYYVKRSGQPWQDVLAQLQRRRPKFRLWPDQERGLREWTSGKQ